MATTIHPTSREIIETESLAREAHRCLIGPRCAGHEAHPTALNPRMSRFHTESPSHAHPPQPGQHPHSLHPTRHKRQTPPPATAACRMSSRYFLSPSPGAAALPDSAGFWSPSTPLSGHTLKAGHFLQPAARAIGHSVMALSLLVRPDPMRRLVSRVFGDGSASAACAGSGPAARHGPESAPGSRRPSTRPPSTESIERRAGAEALQCGGAVAVPCAPRIPPPRGAPCVCRPQPWPLRSSFPRV